MLDGGGVVVDSVFPCPVLGDGQLTDLAGVVHGGRESVFVEVHIFGQQGTGCGESCSGFFGHAAGGVTGNGGHIIGASDGDGDVVGGAVDGINSDGFSQCLACR